MLKETTLEELKQIAEGEVVAITGFVPDKSFNVRLKRLVLENFISDAGGNIPNKLIDKAEQIFYNAELNAKGERKLTKKEVKEIEELENHLLKAMMVNPTYEEVEESGLKLSTLQRQEILIYGFYNVDKLEPFRG